MITSSILTPKAPSAAIDLAFSASTKALTLVEPPNLINPPVHPAGA